MNGAAQHPNLDERRRIALEEEDEAAVTRFHAKVCWVAGVGFFFDAYDTFVIVIAVPMIAYIYGHQGVLTSNQELGLKIAGPLGTLCGQLIFGWLADLVGRKSMYGIELCIMIGATFAQALAGSALTVNILGVIMFWRVIMGIGIGGDYPLSAVITSEWAPRAARGRLMTAVFAYQGWGNLCAALVALIVVFSYRHGIENDPSSGIEARHVDFCWRLLIGLGCIPGVLGIYFRLTIPETPRFTMDIERNVRQATQDITFLRTGSFRVDPDAVVQRANAPKASIHDFMEYFSEWENLKLLMSCSFSWFALDFAFYGFGLNNTIILQAIFKDILSSTDVVPMVDGPARFRALRDAVIGNIILTAAAIPGYYASYFLIERWGRKRIQFMGFAVLTIIFIIMGFGFDAIHSNHGAFVFLCCLASFFFNFGPNTTTFVIPGEVFPTRYRCTGHGLSGAIGKVGAIFAQLAFTKMVDTHTLHGLGHFLEIIALFTLTGIISTWFVPETRGRSLEDLSNEDQENFIQGVTVVVEVRNGLIVDAGERNQG